MVQFWVASIGSPLDSNGEQFIRLDNGEIGLLPEEWFKRYGAILGIRHQTIGVFVNDCLYLVTGTR